MKNGFALISRVNVKDHPIGNYYTFPGGGIEERESLEDGAKREIKEELGIEVNIIKRLYYLEKKEAIEHFFLCEYISGEFGKGTGPEFSNNPEYEHRGEYIPKIIEKQKVKDIMLMPPEIKEKFVKDIEIGIFDSYFKKEG